MLGEVPWWMAWLPIIFAGTAVASLILAIAIPDLYNVHSVGSTILPFYLIWLMSLGAIGSVAFIGMNVLSVQQDTTFDLNNTRLMLLRIALGALFALVLTLPFGFEGFVRFCASIATLTSETLNNTQQGEPLRRGPDAVTIQAMLLLPFILGFSTSLVIMLLNQFVDAIQAFFGKRGGASDRPPSPPSVR